MKKNKVHSYDLNICQVFLDEYNLARDNDIQYSDKELTILQDLIWKTKRFITKNSNPVNGSEKGTEYHRNQDKYYRSLKSDLDQKKQFPEPYFFIDAKGVFEYGLEHDARANVLPKDLKEYGQVFAFKVRHLSFFDLKPFLDYQSAFFSDTELYTEFLSALILEYDFLIEERKGNVIKLYNPPKSKESEPVEKQEEKAKEPVPPEEEFESLRYFPIPGKLTEEEIDHFFSFFYKERNGDSEPFLSKEDTEELLSFGFGIPDESPIKVFKLNITAKKTKSTIAYCFHRLYEVHSQDRFKNEYVEYLQTYFEDFKTISPSTVKGMLRNKKPPKMRFDIEGYLVG